MVLESPAEVWCWALRFGPAVTLIVAVVLIAGIAAGFLLLWWSNSQVAHMAQKDAAALRLDVLKLALAVAGGLGALTTLILAIRKQSTSEHDALEDRITTLHDSAIGQLESANAAVRLGGLHTLERLGQDHPRMRQQIVNLLCFYLRTPFEPPSQRPAPEGVDPVEHRSQHQELQIRNTMQRLLHEHTCNPTSADFWRSERDREMQLDLTGAALMNFRLGGHVDQITLRDATFHGPADLSGIHVRNIADLDGATFMDDAKLDHADFSRRLKMVGTTVHGALSMGGIHCHDAVAMRAMTVVGHAELGEARFDSMVKLLNAKFKSRLEAPKAVFGGEVNLIGAIFDGHALWDGAVFHQDTTMKGTKFNEGANFENAIFHRYVSMENGKFGDDAHFGGTQFLGYTNLGATFTGRGDLTQATYASVLVLDQLRPGPFLILPPGWGRTDREGTHYVQRTEPVAEPRRRSTNPEKRPT